MNMEYYKVNIQIGSDKGTQYKCLFIKSNLFQKDIVSRLFPSSSEIISNGEYINPTCLRFTVFPENMTGYASRVYVTRLYSEDIERIESQKDTDQFKGWRRIYKA